MPRRDYLQHLAAVLQTPPDKSVQEVRRGEDDGSFIVCYIPPVGSGVQNHIEVTGLIFELSDYPTKHQTYLYTSSPDVPAYITNSLRSIAGEGVPISQLIQNIAGHLNKLVAQGSNGSDDDEDSFYDNPDEDENDSIGGWSGDEVPGPESADHDEDVQINDVLHDSRRSVLLPDLRRDLREAKAAGFRIGVLGDIKGGIVCYVSMAIKISKLGLSDEAINAWKLDKDRYLILLIHYSHYYKPLAEVIKQIYHAKQSIRFCVGTSKQYKPTLVEAIGAFSSVVPLQVDNEGNRGTGDGFKGIFISRPLNELLNTRFIDLVKQRMEYRLSWDGSERFLSDFQGKAAQDGASSAYRNAEDTQVNFPSIATRDSLGNSNFATKSSFPLIAMQFTLRHLVRCTEFCLVCHTKISSNFETLKPYVCSNPLCLYQYMALGFGPSIEYEIMSQPTVVDLLISFCYASAKERGLNDFPTGMNLLVPRPINKNNKLEDFQATLHVQKTPHYLHTGHSACSLLKRGDWIQVRCSTEDYPRHYRVLDVSAPKIMIATPTTTQSMILNTQTRQLQSLGFQTSPSDPIKVHVTRFTTNFDSLDASDKRSIICDIIDTIPPVHQMKKWLEENTTVGAQASLRNWTEEISPAACGLIRWIIASNRSCIVPVDEINESGQRSEVAAEPRVWGMGGFIQFRFAMGAPDKEQRFVTAVRDAQGRLNLAYPTIFAFHGSPLANWHSIVREGLHFNKISHGRAYGNGCYHSLALGTSQFYCSPTTGKPSPMWDNSCLNVASAICLNEIINAPSEFVASTPHLVIDKLDWIQTRYLFVSTRKESSPQPGSGSAKTATVSHHGEGKIPEQIFHQDPTRTPVNTLNQKLVIPAAVSSRFAKKVVEPVLVLNTTTATSGIFSRVRLSKANKKRGSKQNPIILDDYESDASTRTEEEDRSILLSDGDEVEPKKTSAAPGTKILSKAANLFSRGSGKAVSKARQTTPLTDFVPGSLDLNGIQILPPPVYASSIATKRLQAELRAILKVQETTPLHELGWYINPDLVNNVYQWVFEFHSFDDKHPLAQDLKERKLTSIVLEARFGSNFPMSPPFVRVIRPRFLGFQQGGGGHVTLGGALCMELLTNSGWSAVSSIESVLLQVRMAITSTEPKPARLLPGPVRSYNAQEAKEAYIRACTLHHWQVPADFAHL